MKTLIAYATKHGAAGKCAEKLLKKLNGDVKLENLKKAKNIDISKYDQVIIGSSVYMGQIRKEARKFCEERLNELKEKTVGLFICCMSEEDTARKQIKDNYPEQLIEKATAVKNFGGGFDFNKMNFLERIIIKKMAGANESESNIIEENIERFAQLINEKIVA
ncbi:MAG: flavodoxin domain-containing protein [Halothermotrichaceae bacterium]